MGHGVRVVKPSELLTTGHSLAGGIGFGALGGLAIVMTALFLGRIVASLAVVIVIVTTIVLTTRDAHRIRSL